MRRGDLYQVRHPHADPKRSRVFVVVSRQALLDSRYSTAICAPVYTRRDGLATQVEVGSGQGLKRDSAIHCDGLMSLSKARLTNYVGTLGPDLLASLDRAIAIAVGLA